MSLPRIGPATDGTPEPLGAHLRDDGVNIAVVARHAHQVVVCWFDAADREVARTRLPARTGDVHHGFIAGIPAGARYGLRVDGPFAPNDGHRYDPLKLLVDPYATRLDRPFAMHPDLALPRPRAVDTAGLVPKAIIDAPLPHGSDRPAPPPAGRRVIYEVNVRAHTRLHPAVPEPDRGTLRGLAHPAVIADMVALGITTVELMPLAAFIDERHLPPMGLTNAWGYNPVVFLAPDPRLAPGGMAEVTTTVAALHAAGLEVILDVVFNHTGESDALGPTVSLRGLDHALYYRLDPHDLTHPVNDTGCGNTLALDRPAPLRLVMDALRHWAAAGIDGFRFDLAPVLGRRADGFDPDAPLLMAIAQDPVLASRLMIAEPWDVGPGGYRLGAFPARWLEWNDRFRHDVRQFWRPWQAARGALATRLAGSADRFDRAARRPSASVNYVAAHDGFTLADLVRYATRHNHANGEDNRDGDAAADSWNHGVEGDSTDPRVNAHRAADVRALLATLMLARGTPMLTAGDEFGRTQHGNNNAYAQDNPTVWLDWSRRDRALERYTANLIRLRATLPALTADTALTGAAFAGGGEPDVVWLGPDGHPLADHDWDTRDRDALGMLLADPDDDAGPRVLAIFNAGFEARDWTLPTLKPGRVWRQRLDSAADVATLDRPIESEAAPIAARSVAVFTEGPASAVAGGIDPDALARLAAAAGIAPDWWSVEGRQTRVSPDTVRALLASLRLPVTSTHDARAHLAALRRERDARMVPTTSVITLGEAPTIRLALDPVWLDRPRHFILMAGDDAIRAFDVHPDTLPLVGRPRIDGSPVEHRALTLPSVPAGRYRLVDADTGLSGHVLVAPPRCYRPPGLTPEHRAHGVAAQLYALRSPRDVGIGDFGALTRWIDAMTAEGGDVIGLNPLHALASTRRDRASPYFPDDRAMLEPLMIDIGAAGEELGVALGDLVDGTAARALRGGRAIDYPAVWALKTAALDRLWAAFVARPADDRLRRAHDRFVAGHQAALAGFIAHEAAARRMAGATDTRIEARIAFEQWLADHQLAGIAERARAAGLRIGLYRDLAVGPAPDGAEAARTASAFADRVSIGAPPDPFSAEGQVWNVPPFDPLHLARTGAGAFAEIVAANMRHAGALRIDHAMGLVRLFFVPAGASAAEGAYVAMPGDLLFATLAIESHAAHTLVVGEDLGTVPAGFAERMARSGVLSTRVMLFERDGPAFRPADRYPVECVACASTHDLPPLVGWRRGRDIDIQRTLGRLPEAGLDAARRARAEDLAALDVALATEGLAPGDASDAAFVAATRAFLERTPALIHLEQVDDRMLEPDPVNVPGTDREYPNWRRRLATSSEPGQA